jgi:hypothetical protein
VVEEPDGAHPGAELPHREAGLPAEVVLLVVVGLVHLHAQQRQLRRRQRELLELVVPRRDPAVHRHAGLLRPRVRRDPGDAHLPAGAMFLLSAFSELDFSSTEEEDLV